MTDKRKTKIKKDQQEEDAPRETPTDRSESTEFHESLDATAEEREEGFTREDFGEPSDDDFDFGDEGRRGLGGAVGEGLKKLFTAGLGAAFLTEESIRSYLQDVKLPKEVLNLFLQGAAKSKEQLMNRVGNEVISIIQKIDFVKEASRFVETHKFRVSAEIEVVKKEADDGEEHTTVSVNMNSKKSKD